MTLKEVQAIIRQLVEYDIEEFEYEKAGVRLRIRRNRLGSHSQQQDAKPVLTVEASLPPPPPSTATATPLPAAGDLAETAAAERANEFHIIRSPLVGTFYKAPNPNAAPFVKIGSKVEEGQVLCIVEAMKLMNEIESDLAGEIVEVYVENKQPVEYGQALFAICPSAKINR